MAFKAILTIEDKTFSLLECWSYLKQKTDRKGKPMSDVHGGWLEFVLVGSNDDTIPMWAADKTKTYDGTIALYQWNPDEKFREIAFEKAYVVFFSESFKPDSDNDAFEWMNFLDLYEDRLSKMTQRIHKDFGMSYLFTVAISAAKISINGIHHDNKW